MSGVIVLHRISRDALADKAEELLDGVFRLALVAGHDDGDRLRGGWCTCSLASGRTAASSSNASCPQRSRGAVAGVGVVPRRPVRTRDARPVRHPPDRPSPAAPAGPARPLAAGLAPDARRRRARTAFGSTGGPSRSVTVEAPGLRDPGRPGHAGLIEPGHFRFSVVGETILKLKARLWFVHRGIEKLFQGRARTDASSWPNGSAATPPSATPWPSAWPSRTPRHHRAARG